MPVTCPVAKFGNLSKELKLIFSSRKTILSLNFFLIFWIEIQSSLFEDFYKKKDPDKSNCVGCSFIARLCNSSGIFFYNVIYYFLY